MKGRIYTLGTIGAILMIVGLSLENEISEALQWIGTGMFVSFVFLISSLKSNQKSE